MKRKITLRALLFMLGIFLGIGVQAAEKIGTKAVNNIGTTIVGELKFDLFDNGTASVYANTDSITVDPLEIPAKVSYNNTDYSVTKIKDEAFSFNKKIASVIVPNSVTNIGKQAFSNCYTITSITLPNSVTKIGEQAFASCNKLKSITIPENVTEIDRLTFYGCASLTSITIPSNITAIGERAFQNCTNLTNIVIPDKVIRIDDGAFDYCTHLTSVTIGSGTAKISTTAFSKCSKLNVINVSEENQKFASVDGVLYDKAKTTLIKFPIGKSTNYTIPANTSVIGDYAFALNESLVSVTLPNSVTKIGNSGFSGCSNLASITLSDNLTTLEYGVFQNCGKLSSITLPASVTDIGNYAFLNCTGLERVYSLNTFPPYCGTNCFLDFERQISLQFILFIPYDSTPDYQLANGWHNIVDMREFDGTSISDISNEGIKIYASSNKIVLENIPEGETVSICNLAGATVYQGIDTEIMLNSGIYLVKAGNTIRKVTVR